MVWNLSFPSLGPTALPGCRAKVLSVVNEKMGFDPPLIPTDLERSHRLGRVVSGQKRPRAVIVRFVSERMRDSVYRARGSLKGYNDGKEQHTRILYNTLFSREEIFAKSEFEIFSREDIFANILFTRKYLPAKISSRKKYLPAKISSRENIFPRKYLSANCFRAANM